MLPVFDDSWVLAQRGDRPVRDPWRPSGCLVEQEPLPDGRIVDVGVIFLANRECPFRCLMCDLWKYATPERVPNGAIPRQIETALAELPPLRHLKLYNAGNFFDAQAIPAADLPRVADLLQDFDRVIVECHPKLIDRRCLQFRDRLRGRLEIAMGLETTHPDVLPRLNKRMTLDDFAHAARFLTSNGIGVRAFILLRPPFLTEREGVDWARRSIAFAFQVGVGLAVVIPTRGGNGAMERLAERGLFHPPSLRSLEDVLAWGIEQCRGIVLGDLWDAASLAHCSLCGEKRLARLARMNLEQAVLPLVPCRCEADHAP